MTLAFAVTGMHCASCGLLIDDTVEQLTGVERSETDSRRGCTVVRADLEATTSAEIVAAIAAAGYTAAPEERPRTPNHQRRSQWTSSST